jgi:hypothetical protein
LAADRLAFDDSPEGERLPRFDLACSRGLARSLDSLLKLRRAPELVACPTSVVDGPLSAAGDTLESSAMPNETNEATDACEIETNEATVAGEIVTNEPTDACEIMTDEPTFSTPSGGSLVGERYLAPGQEPRFTAGGRGSARAGTGGTMLGRSLAIPKPVLNGKTLGRSLILPKTDRINPREV